MFRKSHKMIRITDSAIDKNGKIKWREIGVDPNTVTGFNASSCNLLKVLPPLPCCLHLYCRDCPLLEALPPLTCCIQLFCIDCPLLKALHLLPRCIQLECCDCPLLKVLPPLPGCTRLHCRSCPSLEVLPALPCCTRLFCRNCPLLEALPSLPCCTELECDVYFSRYFKVGYNANENAKACQEYQMLSALFSPRIIRRLRSPLCKVYRLPPELGRMLKEFLN